MMRIVAALFLKQTMAVANTDADRLAHEKMNSREALALKLRDLFRMGDVSGDGLISKTEFCNMIADPTITALLGSLELEMYELDMLFSLLCDDDGYADYEEFLGGALKMKHCVRTIDMLQIIHSQAHLARKVDTLTTGLEYLHTAFELPTPWIGKPSAEQEEADIVDICDELSNGSGPRNGESEVIYSAVG